jgi:adhesin/invasin
MVKVTSGQAVETARAFLRIHGNPVAGGGAGQVGPQTPSAVQVSPASIEFNSTNGVTTPASAPLEIKAATPGLSFNATVSTTQGGPWLGISTASGVIPATIQATANAAGLAAGVYTGLIRINVTGAISEQRLIPVVLRVAGASGSARLTVSRGGVVFQARPNAAAPAPQQIQLGTIGAANIPYQSTFTGGNWLTVSPAAGSAPATVTLTVNQGVLPQGLYRGEVVFQPTGGSSATPVSLDVLLVVTPNPAAGPAASADGTLTGIFLQPSAEFSLTAGLPAAVTVMLLDGQGNPALGGEVLVSTGGDSPVWLTELGGGVYGGESITLPGGPAAVVAEATVRGGATVRFAIGGDAETINVPAPEILLDGIVSAAGFSPAPAPVAAGSILSLFGLNLATETANAAQLPLPRELSGLKVLVAGVEAPLIALFPGEEFDQLNFQLPAEAGALSAADVVIERGGFYSGPRTLSIAPAVPAIFTLTQDGAGPAAALDARFSLITTDNPASPGEIVHIFATGLGQTTPALQSGQAPVSLSRTVLPLAATIGGRTAEVAFAGLAPGFAGLYQINLVVPPGLGTGDQPVVLKMDGISSGEGVTLRTSAR